MSKWKKVSLREAAGKNVFDEEWGFIYVSDAPNNISYTIVDMALNQFYVDNADGQKVPLSIDTNDPKQIMKIFSKTLYYNQRNEYGYSTARWQSVTVENITVCLNNVRKAFTISKNDKERLEYLRYVWICDGLRDEEKYATIKELKKPLLQNLKAGDCLFCDKGKCKINKLYPQPNENNLMFQAVLDFEGCDKQPFDVSFTDNVYVLPYEKQPISETARFNESQNEIWLSPYAVKTKVNGQYWTMRMPTVNVYWNKIDSAVGYIVSLYIKFDRPYLQSVYHLKDYFVDRNDGFLVIDNLLSDGYIVTVKAEDRNGEEIALSRGIYILNDGSSFPQYF